MDPNRIQDFLQIYFNHRSSDVQLIGAGWFSQAFSFSIGDQGFTFRVNQYEEDLKKDALAYQYFVAPQVPIPCTVRCGQYDKKHYYMITERVPGKKFNQLSHGDALALTPQLFETLEAIQSTDISGLGGWGLADASGQGRFASWEVYLMSVYNQKFKDDWRDLASYTFLEHSLYARYLDEMERLLPYCSQEKSLIHRDIGGDNILSDGERITGVLDWADFGLGDSLFDIAYLDYWPSGIPYADLWRERAAEKGQMPEHFEERLSCYKLWIALDSMRIAAVKDDWKMYLRNRERARRACL